MIASITPTYAVATFHGSLQCEAAIFDQKPAGLFPFEILPGEPWLLAVAIIIVNEMLPKKVRSSGAIGVPGQQLAVADGRRRAR